MTRSFEPLWTATGQMAEAVPRPIVSAPLTVKAAGLESYTYLRHIFEKLPQAVTLADIEALLPWNVDAAALNATR